mgnify:CR=1 FL=1
MRAQRLDFDMLAQTWDEDPGRAERARELAAAIAERVPLQDHWVAMDYGCGTGTLSLLLASRLAKVVAVDNSQGMLTVLADKLAAAGVSNVEARRLDLTTEAAPAEQFDLIVSSMALHHIADAGSVVVRLGTLLRSGGYLAVADLDAEDGSFHGDGVGEVHHGFSEAQMRDFMAAAGLSAVGVNVAHVMVRPGSEGAVREYPVLLTIARKA